MGSDVEGMERLEAEDSGKAKVGGKGLQRHPSHRPLTVVVSKGHRVRVRSETPSSQGSNGLKAFFTK